ncbi:hypothetical protein N431DRAFT_521625 [Stipitochalara longipes BDJ]|nr:hypothetical protein N431DRAFT_521625 [Stipitochalara longipes BDJ]
MTSEREFILFPKLPPELRLKIWKHALPSPRVIPLSIDDSYTRPCRSSNALIVIRLACHEALSIVEENYDKYVPVLGSQSDFIQDDHGRQAFIYINYDIDTVYINEWGRFEKIQVDCLSKAKHLSWRAAEPLSHDFHWAVLRAALFLDIPKGFGTSMRLPQWDGGWDGGPLADILDEYGHLAIYCAEAKQVRDEFHEYVKERAEWKTVSFKFAMLGTRPIGFHSRPWNLSYFLYTPSRYDDDDDDESEGEFGYGESHWHEEPITIGRGDLGSCRPREEKRKHYRCFICREQRWLMYNDAFWLAQDDQMSLDGIDAFSEFSSESLEDTSEEDLEETTDEEDGSEVS